MYALRYTSHVVSKQPGYWRLELKPITKPAAPPAVRQRKKEPVPLSLQQFIRANGGLDPEYNRGQWAGELRMVRDSGKQGLMPGVLNRSAKKTFEEMAEACSVAGYLSEASIDEMLFGLAKDIEATLTGEKRNRVYGHSGIDYKVNLDLERWKSLLPENA